MMQIFFSVVCEVLKGFEEVINRAKAEQFLNKAKNVGICDVFDYDSFIKNKDYSNEKGFRTFLDFFTRTQLFTEFLEHYLKHKNERRQLFVNSYLKLASDKNSKFLCKEYHKEFLKNKFVEMHYYNYISTEKALKLYIEKNGSISTNKKNINDKLVWNSLDKAKIANFNIPFEKCALFDTEDKVIEDNYRKIFSELTKFREQALCMNYLNSAEVNEEEEDIERNQINSQETKLKSYLENYYSNSSPRKISFQKVSFEASKTKSIDMLNSFELMKNNSNASLGQKHTTPFANPSEHSSNKSHTNFDSGKIINCENNIENLVVNNINISHDHMVNPYILLSENKLNKTNMNSVNNSDFNSLSSINLPPDNLTTRNSNNPNIIFSQQNIFKDVKIPVSGISFVNSKKKRPSFDLINAKNINNSNLQSLFNSNIEHKVNMSLQSSGAGTTKFSSNQTGISNQKKIIFQHFQRPAQGPTFSNLLSSQVVPIPSARKNENIQNLQKLNGDDDDDDKLLD